ncbi:exopolysaccharide biosynthesis polyprenyl glycosylphosphotransferase [Nguyenibacter vanlangensis]|uniref:Exopolysaccharide biosynthesis polyprenyl glycosylphosphotransferase n=1 Tax=Nguyenibacter vanlangensis TaxID=1216886 RepID=A0A7Y7M6P7_9PROT|nr:exopolysaccharide biosynthesis polyprenyl glycosylphosphotransferase [Nguyenibacter vanlangensis]NVN11184.1 exopolysaccharide biosynthesis polyprenyl glycosylphosphotransferase [Nguyenibacter vanlangensis]
MSESYSSLQSTIDFPDDPLRQVESVTKPAESGVYPYYHPVLSGMITSIDGLTVMGATLLTAYVGPEVVHQHWVMSQSVANLMSVLGFLMAPKKRSLIYVPTLLQASAQLRYLAPPLLIGALLHAVVLSMLRHPIAPSAELAAVWLFCSALALGAVRGTEIALLGSSAISGQLARNVAIVGSDETAIKFAARIAGEAGPTYRMIGVFDDHDTALNPNAVDGTLEDLIVRSRETPLHAIILAIPSHYDPHDHVAEISWRLRSVLSDVYVLPNVVHGIDVVLPIEQLGPFALLVLQRRPLSDWQAVKKTMLDMVLGAIALVILAPVLAIVAIAIKATSPGPVFFKQPRLGFNNRTFMVYKFRSMYTNMSDMMAARQTSRDDPRVTPVGRWLRKLSIDELPQLLNVLRGEMSLVGPRPHAPHTRAGGMLLDDALAEYVIRHQVKPGITGWAQVNGARGELVTIDDLRRRVTYDLEYIQKWSLRFDIKIMALTVLREVFSRHAF